MEIINESGIKYHFFTGKGGVGKTTLSCATAVKYVNNGEKVLLVCTDPASNLTDVLGVNVGPSIEEHHDLKGLFTINIDPEVSADDYRAKVMKTLGPEATQLQKEKLEESLQGACTVEIASFDQFSRFITGDLDGFGFDRVIFDTAPTGHTLRLLELPGAWETYLDDNPRGGSSIRPSTGMTQSKERYERVVELLSDPSQTVFNLVARPDHFSLDEASRTANELVDMGYSNQRLFINGIFSAMDSSDELAVKMDKFAHQVLATIQESLKKLEIREIPLLPYNIYGVDKLISVFDEEKRSDILEELAQSQTESFDISYAKALVDDLSKQSSGLIMTMGKGGVGKTILASYIALMLVEAGHEVILTTTDPAAHISGFLSQLDSVPENLEVQSIDPKVETEKYRESAFSKKSKGMTEEEKKVLWEDLQTPCNQEISVFLAFSRMLRTARKKFVVMDTAPTGHTLLLLDTAGTYHNEIMHSSNLQLDHVTTPYMALQNPDFAKLVLVTLPEMTPINEALELQEDLKRANISPYAWVVNQSLMGNSEITDPILKNKQATELSLLKELKPKVKQLFSVPLFFSNNRLGYLRDLEESFCLLKTME